MKGFHSESDAAFSRTCAFFIYHCKRLLATKTKIRFFHSFLFPHVLRLRPSDCTITVQNCNVVFSVFFFFVNNVCILVKSTACERFMALRKLKFKEY